MSDKKPPSVSSPTGMWQDLWRTMPAVKTGDPVAFAMDRSEPGTLTRYYRDGNLVRITFAPATGQPERTILDKEGGE